MTQSTEQITRYTLTPDPGEKYWYLTINMTSGYPAYIDYVDGISTSIYPPIWGADIRQILLNEQAEALPLVPPLPNAINIWKAAKKHNILPQLNFSQMEVMGINQIHNPRNIVKHYGAFPGVKLFYLWLADFTFQDMIDCYKSLLDNRKISIIDLEEELTHMVNGTEYPNQVIITEQEKQTILDSI